MSGRHALEALLVRTLRAAARALPLEGALALGAALGEAARALGLRRAVAEENLARAFLERTAAERADILAAHYRDLGMMMCEAARGGRLFKRGEDQVIAAARGVEHLDAVRRAGRGAILLTAHYGDFGLLGAWLARRHPVDIFGKPLQNPAVEALLVRTCAEGGMGRIVAGTGMRRLIAGLKANRWIVMLADQDAGAGGVFVPFLGRACSTTSAPAEISLRTGAPIVMAFITRRPDRRHDIDVLPPLALGRPVAPDPVRALTARHTALLERWVRGHPPMWFWLHRRWKTPPPSAAPVGVDARSAGMPAADAPVARRA